MRTRRNNSPHARPTSRMSATTTTLPNVGGKWGRKLRSLKSGSERQKIRGYFRRHLVLLGRRESAQIMRDRRIEERIHPPEDIERAHRATQPAHARFTFFDAHAPGAPQSIGDAVDIVGVDQNRAAVELSGRARELA